MVIPIGNTMVVDASVGARPTQAIGCDVVLFLKLFNGADQFFAVLGATEPVGSPAKFGGRTFIIKYLIHSYLLSFGMLSEHRARFVLPILLILFVILQFLP